MNNCYNSRRRYIKIDRGLTSIVPIISVEAGTYRITNSIGNIEDLCG
jgi:hypothetical protein